MAIKPTKDIEAKRGTLPPKPTRGKLAKALAEIEPPKPLTEVFADLIDDGETMPALQSEWTEDAGLPIRGQQLAFVEQRKIHVEYRATDSLVGYARNARKHTEQEVDQLAGWIKEIGWTNPILLDGTNGIMAGHRRLAAARKLNMQTVPVIELAHLSEAQRRAYILFDNQSTIQGDWDEDMLKIEVQDLEAMGFDLEELGFSDKELGELLQPLGAEGLTDDDEVPAPPKVPVTKPGDVWQLDTHRVMCGDARNSDDVNKLMHGVLADLVITDPPYGVDFKRGAGMGRAKAPRDDKFEPIANDHLKGQELATFITDVMVAAFIASKDAPFYVWSAPMQEGSAILDGLINAGLQIQCQIIWEKTPFVIGRGDYHWKHEVCWYGFKKGKSHSWYGGRDKGTVWQIPKLQKMEHHPTQKPVELFEVAIKNSSKGGDIILDLFGGSGTTLIACQRLERHARIMDIEPVYVDTMILRWQAYTGKKAILESTGELYDELKPATAEGIA